LLLIFHKGFVLLNLERCVAEDLEGEGEILKTFTVDATVEGVSKDGAVTGKIY
jgi:hypothetical protein